MDSKMSAALKVIEKLDNRYLVNPMLTLIALSRHHQIEMNLTEVEEALVIVNKAIEDHEFNVRREMRASRYR